MNGITFALVFLEGVLAFISPCILPLLPIYVLYLSGQVTRTGRPVASGHAKTLSDATASDLSSSMPQDAGADASKTDTASDDTVNTTPSRRRLMVNTLFFILGFTIVFLAMGATSTALGQALIDHRSLLERIAGVVIILLGLHMTGLLRIPFLQSDHRFGMKKTSGGIFTSLLMGIAFSLGWTPCLGPFLGAALLVSSQSETMLEGMALLFTFSMGLAVPFLLTSMLFDQLASVFSWFRKHALVIRIISGILLIVLGLLMLLGLFGDYARIFTI
jgi:cytochrome c-type biogenesis protein